VSRELDALTGSTLKYLRERWWDDSFTGVLAEEAAVAGRELVEIQATLISATAGRRLAE